MRSPKNTDGVLTHRVEQYNKCLALLDMCSLNSLLEEDISNWINNVPPEQYSNDTDEEDEMKALMERNRRFREGRDSQSYMSFSNSETTNEETVYVDPKMFKQL